MDTPCTKCLTITVAPVCQSWINTLEITKSDPDVTVSGISFSSSSSAFNFYAAVCDAVSGNWAACGEPLTCWACDSPISPFIVYNMGPAVLNCNYTATIAFPNVTLNPVSAWTGDAFTMQVQSADPRILISPSSVEIPNGFNDPIVLTLTLNPVYSNPMSVSVLSDLDGNCAEPAVSAWGFDTTPVLTC